MIARLGATAGLLLSLAAGAQAQIAHTEVEYRSPRYTVSFDVLIDRKPAEVRALLADYDSWARFSDIITGVRLMTSNPVDGDLINMRMRVCMLFVCRSVNKVQQVQRRADGEIVAALVPGTGRDFRMATERWRILPAATGTRVRYQGEFEPGFFVPPVIGPMYVKGRLRDELLQTIHALETLETPAEGAKTRGMP